MKKITVLAILIIFAAQASQAQTAYTEKRQASGFDEVTFALAGEVLISIGSGYSVELEGDRDYLSEIITEVVGGELRIRTEKWFNTGNKKVIVRITMPALAGLKISGSGKVTVKDPLRGGDLDVAISGSGKIYLHDVALGDVECSISGSGSLNVAGSGTIKSLEMSVSGSGDYLGEATKVGTLEARISGSGNVDCYVTDMLRASISGSGSIFYSGNPKIDASVSGSGKVRMK
ncbi:MAG: head GIN domain-containing protein [Bacteroidales bacterium]